MNCVGNSTPVKKRQYVLDLLDQEAWQERKPRSAGVPTMLEAYFEREKAVAEIPADPSAIFYADLSRALALQKTTFQENLSRDILLEEGSVEQGALEHALMNQKRQMRN